MSLTNNKKICPFKENKDLVRELLRIRGSFFIN